MAFVYPVFCLVFIGNLATVAAGLSLRPGILLVIGHITLCPFGRRQRQQPWGIGSLLGKAPGCPAPRTPDEPKPRDWDSCLGLRQNSKNSSLSNCQGDLGGTGAEQTTAGKSHQDRSCGHFFRLRALLHHAGIRR